MPGLWCRTFGQKKRILIVIDALSGLEYLHWKHIVHFDLKCDNLLVNMRNPRRAVCKVKAPTSALHRHLR